MDGLMIVLSAVAITESMLLIAQSEEMSEKDDRIRIADYLMVYYQSHINGD